MDDRRPSRCGLGGRGSARHARRDASHDPDLQDPAFKDPTFRDPTFKDLAFKDPAASAAHETAASAVHDPAAGLPGASRDDPAARIIARLADIGSRLGAQPRQEFRARLRESLLSAHESGRQAAGRHARPAARAAVPPPPPIRTSLLVRLRPAVLVLTLVAVTLLTSWGTHRAVPGDMLYPLKRGAESALVKLSIDATSRAERELATARNRAAEAAKLAEDPKAKKLLDATIDDMASSTRSALSTLTRVKPRNTGNSRKIRRFATEQRNVVEPILPSLKGSSREKANAYLHLIQRYEAP
ncbi:DUF5667 domain-containing protein [Thermopolyspora sp. NPDC052614]|uniref:DUF5667 domain-containing protein n=1 Tax=Thermopolyspora sp. NPDC052614 TaxID=3155682 RepID=UPI00342C0797